jgi:polyphosphate kinase
MRVVGEDFELMFPILRPELRDRIVGMLEEQFADNQKARRLKPDGSYERIAPGKAEPARRWEFPLSALSSPGRSLSSPLLCRSAFGRDCPKIWTPGIF